MDRFRIGRGTVATLAVVAVGVVGGGVAYAATQGDEGNSSQAAPGVAPGAAAQGGTPQGQMSPGGPGGPDGRCGPGGPPLEAAADYIGISVDDLQTELEDGSTPGEVAEAEGKSADGLRKALVDDATGKLDQAVEDGKLDDAQRDEILDSLEEHVKAFVNGERPPMPGGAPQGAPMPGGAPQGAPMPGAPQQGGSGQGGNQGSSVPEAPSGSAPVTLENL